MGDRELCACAFSITMLRLISHAHEGERTENTRAAANERCGGRRLSPDFTVAG